MKKFSCDYPAVATSPQALIGILRYHRKLNHSKRWRILVAELPQIDGKIRVLVVEDTVENQILILTI